MAKRIKQYRFYENASWDGISANQPKSIRIDSEDHLIDYFDYCNGKVFENNFPILQLGIQALPGTKFLLNDAVEPIIIGSTGIYELDLGGQTEITSLKFEKESMELINDNKNAFLIVDTIYEDGKEEFN